MPSTGTKKTGFALAVLGPFHCGNCRKLEGDVCMDEEVAHDSEIPGYKSRMTADGHVRVDRDECCNEFYSLKDSPGKRNSGLTAGRRFGKLLVMNA